MLVRPASSLVQEQSFTERHKADTFARGALAEADKLFKLEAAHDPRLGDEVMLGTTIIAISFKGGVVLAADTRTSSGTLVVNRAANKITKLSDRIYTCRSGSAADTQHLAALTGNYLQQHAIDIGREPTVSNAAGLLHRIVYNNKHHLSAGMIVAGWDEISGGSVYDIPSSGGCLKLDYVLGGSGSIFLYSLMDRLYKPGMSRAECQDLARQLVSHALSRDASSGGMVRMVTIDQNGTEQVTTPYTALPYRLETDEAKKVLAVANPPPSSTGRATANHNDSSVQ